MCYSVCHVDINVNRIFWMIYFILDKTKCINTFLTRFIAWLQIPPWKWKYRQFCVTNLLRFSSNTYWHIARQKTKDSFIYFDMLNICWYLNNDNFKFSNDNHQLSTRYSKLIIVQACYNLVILWKSLPDFSPEGIPSNFGKSYYLLYDSRKYHSNIFLKINMK